MSDLAQIDVVPRIQLRQAHRQPLKNGHARYKALFRQNRPIASFLHDVEFDRYRGIADMAGIAGDPPPSRMTHIRHHPSGTPAMRMPSRVRSRPAR